MPRTPIEEIDNVNRNIIRILSNNPRSSYREIAVELEELGIELSAEAVRKRVATILETTSPFFLLAPEEHGWEIVRVGISLESGTEAKVQAFEDVIDTDAWLICRGFGSFDIWAVATARTNAEIDEFLTEVRGIENVVDVSYFIETKRATMMDDYLSAAE